MRTPHPNYRVNPALTTALFCNNPDCLRPRRGGYGHTVLQEDRHGVIRHFCSGGCIREFYAAPLANAARINMYLKKIPLEQGEAKPGEDKEREASDKGPPCLSAGESPTGGGAGANPPSNSAASRSRKNDDPYAVSGYEGTEGME